MNIGQISAVHKRRPRGLKLATLLLLAPFIVTLGATSMLGQGFKVNRVNMPGSQDNQQVILSGGF